MKPTRLLSSPIFPPWHLVISSTLLLSVRIAETCFVLVRLESKRQGLYFCRRNFLVSHRTSFEVPFLLQISHYQFQCHLRYGLLGDGKSFDAKQHLTPLLEKFNAESKPDESKDVSRYLVMFARHPQFAIMSLDFMSLVQGKKGKKASLIIKTQITIKDKNKKKKVKPIKVCLPISLASFRTRRVSLFCSFQLADICELVCFSLPQAGKPGQPNPNAEAVVQLLEKNGFSVAQL